MAGSQATGAAGVFSTCTVTPPCCTSPLPVARWNRLVTKLSKSVRSNLRQKTLGLLLSTPQDSEALGVYCSLCHINMRCHRIKLNTFHCSLSAHTAISTVTAQSVCCSPQCSWYHFQCSCLKAFSVLCRTEWPSSLPAVPRYLEWSNSLVSRK